MTRFRPMLFGARLWIAPTWSEVPKADDCTVVLDPGLAFGTGTHATTALCLEWLEAADLLGKTIFISEHDLQMGKHALTFSLPELARGLYTLSVTDFKNYKVSKKVFW